MEQLIAAAADTTPIDVNMDNFMAEVIDGSATMPIVVQFWAPWCGPCKQLGPLLEKVVAAAKGKVKMVRINIDENQQIAQQMRVQSVPTVYGFFNGQPVDGFAGAQPESTLKQFIDKLVAAGGSGPDIAAMVAAANNLLETQDYENAMAQYHEIMAADPESPDGLAGMIRCMVGMKDIEGAREIVDQLDDEFRDKPAMVIAVESLELAEKAAGAAGGLTQARAAVDADPNNLAARQELALALFATGEQAESMEQLLESIRIDRSWNEEAARVQLLEFFKTLGPANHDVMAARRKLSTLLFA
ncbi:thioredoxin [Alphaproteobacteria bacterium]|jgi:putative thioredoxin|nr:thioredoxin [Alphaproteobacteria bacterium]MDA9013198.1 thioredoxin [Alphaproteobacteria bacterium]MDA9055402.1 thioredoxin [Alphaproteobacteria bacterium]